MYDLPTGSFGEILGTLWRLGVGSLLLDPAAFEAGRSSLVGLALSLALLILGGASEQLGQMVVLVANRVRPARFALSVFLSGSATAAGVVFWTLSIWFLATALFEAWMPLWQLLAIVVLCHVPLVLGFMELVPYLGYLGFHLLRGWIFLNTVTATAMMLDLRVWQAAICCGSGWGFLTLLTHLRILPLHLLQDLLWRLATGLPERHTVAVLIERFTNSSDWAHVGRRRLP